MLGQHVYVGQHVRSVHTFFVCRLVVVSTNDILRNVIFAGVVGLAPGTFHTMLVKQDGSVWSTGVESDVRSDKFVQVIPSGASAVAAGNYCSTVLMRDDTVLVTCKNSKGRFELSFFDGSTTSEDMYPVVKMIPGAKAVAAGGYHTLVVTEEGRVWAMGWNKYGQLGDRAMQESTRFIRARSEGAIAVAAGDIHSVVLNEDGSVWATGRNSDGQLGDGSKTDRNNFVKVMLSGGVAVVAGGYHSMVAKQDGSVWATGSNAHGQLGHGPATDRINYVQVVSFGVKAIAAGSRHSMVMKQDGSVWATGYNLYGQLGDGTTVNAHTFELVMPDGAQAVAAGAYHSMVLKQDGSVWVTGSNKYGQFGDGTTASETSFVKLSPFSNGAGNNAIRRICPASIIALFWHCPATKIDPTIVFSGAMKLSDSDITVPRDATSDGADLLAGRMYFRGIYLNLKDRLECVFNTHCYSNNER